MLVNVVVTRGKMPTLLVPTTPGEAAAEPFMVPSLMSTANPWVALVPEPPDTETVSVRFICVPASSETNMLPPTAFEFEATARMKALFVPMVNGPTVKMAIEPPAVAPFALTAFPLPPINMPPEVELLKSTEPAAP